MYILKKTNKKIIIHLVLKMILLIYGGTQCPHIHIGLQFDVLRIIICIGFLSCYVLVSRLSLSSKTLVAE